MILRQPAIRLWGEARHTRQEPNEAWHIPVAIHCVSRFSVALRRTPLSVSDDEGK